MTVYFRLLAGFTSFMWFLRSVHFCSSGPLGILEFRAMALLPVSNEAREDGHGDGDVGEGDDDGGSGGEALHPLRVPGMRQAEGSEHRVHAVPEVESESDHGDDVRQHRQG